jgi:hypothetical protein
MAGKRLVMLEIRFVSDRVRESVSTIVGKEALEDFRVRTMPLDRPKGERGGLRPVE